jgi:hypothetical protein
MREDMKNTGITIATLGLCMLLAGVDVAQAEVKITEFQASRDAVREFCAGRGKALFEGKRSTTCVIRRTGAELTCDDDSNCVRKE